jgi:hypothetical protein
MRVKDETHEESPISYEDAILMVGDVGVCWTEGQDDWYVSTRQTVPNTYGHPAGEIICVSGRIQKTGVCR